MPFFVSRKCVRLITAVIFCWGSVTSGTEPQECGDIAEFSAGTPLRDFVRAGDFPGSILVPGSDVSVKVGGYTKFDFIYDFDAIGSTDFFDTTTIPTNGEMGSNVRMHARQSRLNLDVRGPTDLGDVRVFVEGDFYGDGNTFRLRHGYGQLGGLLAGQTWSTFMDETILPDLLDFESPRALVLTRRALLRWTQPLSIAEGLEYSLAIEDPSPKFQSNLGEFEGNVPDFIGRLRFDDERWHFQAAGFVSSAGFVPNMGADSNAVAWGVNLSGRAQVVEGDSFYYQFAWGNGAERFRSGQSYTLDSTGSLVAIPVFSWYAGYQHQWAENWKSVVSYNHGTLDLPAGMPTIPDSGSYFAANILWTPIERVRVGLEYLHGTNETQNGNSGSANRLQFAIWYYLP